MTKKFRNDENELFLLMVKSAFEFLNKSLDEFENTPRHSVVHFATAVELFLKARLLREHWCLVVDKVDNAKFNDLAAGKAKTVNIDTTINRLSNIASDPISEEARNTFKTIAQHRNRVLHFVHGFQENEQGVISEIEKIVVEQCSGWWHLQSLLDRNWKNHFSEFRKTIHRIEMKMQRQRHYLEQKFKAKTKEIEEHTKRGAKVRRCHCYHFEALIVSHVSGSVSDANCVVCCYAGTVINLTCPQHKCHQEIEFDSYQGPPDTCPSCQNPIADWVAEGLDTGELITKDNICDHFDINCSRCLGNGYHSVIQHKELYICTNCFEYDQRMGICEWCGEGVLGGISENSYYEGCEFCDGKSGWDGD